MSLQFIRKQYPNIPHNDEDDGMSEAEHMANLMHRVLALAKCLDIDAPEVITNIQMGLIYIRLEEMEEVFGIEPEYPLSSDEDEKLTNCKLNT